MPIERLEITDRTTWLKWRAEDITASVGACLFGDIHPYTTAYREWALRSGLLSSTSQIDPKLIRRGDVIERIAPQIIEEERPGWLIAKSSHYYRDPEARIGATPDLIASRPDIEGVGNIQVKSVGTQAFRQWKDRDTGLTQLPMWIAIQTTIEAYLMEATWAAVAAITIGDGGLDVEIIDVPLVETVMAKWSVLAADFWRRVAEKEPYDIDWGKDAATVLDMYRDDDGATIDLDKDEEFESLLIAREVFKRIEKDAAAAEKSRREIDAQIIHKMGNAKAARIGNVFVKAPTIKVKEAVRKAYSFRKISVIHDDERADRSPRTGSAA